MTQASAYKACDCTHTHASAHTWNITDVQKSFSCFQKASRCAADGTS